MLDGQRVDIIALQIHLGQPYDLAFSLRQQQSGAEILQNRNQLRAYLRSLSLALRRITE